MTLISPEPGQPETVLDASALLAYLNGEPGGDVLHAVLSHSVISSVNWSEVWQKAVVLGRASEGRREDLEALGLSIAPFTAEDAESAAFLWRQTRHLGLSLADRACLALARRLGLPVLTADRAWQDIEVAVTVHMIR